MLTGHILFFGRDVRRAISESSITTVGLCSDCLWLQNIPRQLRALYHAMPGQTNRWKSGRLEELFPHTGSHWIYSTLLICNSEGDFRNSHTEVTVSIRFPKCQHPACSWKSRVNCKTVSSLLKIIPSAYPPHGIWIANPGQGTVSAGLILKGSLEIKTIWCSIHICEWILQATDLWTR